ncbi:MAG: hypothetical protein L6263_12205 [Desulfobacteraceae bacterium]|nr:hypothetical protein [Pseudomonadota bacterium]MBU4260174.1 hypothetical protein [Pseudomonadota bacterium]MBU4415175.1 hypothetical protein [Pseudomonadota bacterium]MCG2759177.1 hypothetical protein [Desulfobacteraceae bacterium]
MNVTKKVVVEFFPLEIERLLAILMDEDREDAFFFLKEVLERKIKDKLRPHCVPVFEASYNPGQKDKFSKKIILPKS